MINSLKKILRQTQPKYFYQNWIEIDSSKILANYNLYSTLADNVFPVLKANAYGHGITQIAQILQAKKIEYFVVDGYFEALQIQQSCPDQKILVMGYVDVQNLTNINFKKIAIVVQSVEVLQSLLNLSKPINIHLELNTGMNRWGLNPSELKDFLKILSKQKLVKLEGVMSHLADADGDNNHYTSKQIQVFDSCVRQVIDTNFRPKYIHLGQSAGSIKTQQPQKDSKQSEYANTIRVGLGLYGYNPLQSTDLAFDNFCSLQPALTFKSRLIKVFKIKAGEPVSYNCTWIASEDTWIGVIAVGYYEGLPREWNQKAEAKVKIDENYYPLVGRICMNLSMINLGVESNFAVGCEVEIFSQSGLNSILNVAVANQTIPYTLLVGINNFVHKSIKL